ncbi:FHA domain-containing protein [Paludisphaera mucosa]|uniref:FHA domain-containing protein n=1 Tax=Paludisphaera mucosa TaxID=3030827 RepID=A0ABT6FKQ2_9BACT|nr:FHA domain-containing protein [Paludisphaera mucosa]MDG3008117.1 FHA domain-containing protein [Paludisphaera mucosa]
MKSFLDACRLVEPLELVVEAAGEPDVGVRLLHQPFALIGRDPRADVPLEHRLVSRRHVYLQVVEGHAFWIDLESRLGTLGGGRPRKYGWLTREENLRIGPYELRRPPGAQVAGGDDRIPDVIPLVARSYGTTPWPEVGLEFLNGPSRAAVWPMNRVVSLVGSAAGCKFRLADPSVSLFHCSLVRTQAGLWVVDLLGGGVEVNNAAVRYALLADGDVLAIGRYRIRIQSRAALEGPASRGGYDAAGRADRAGAGSRALSLVRSPSPGGTELAVTREDEDDEGAGRGRAIQAVTVIPVDPEGGNLGDSVSVLVPLMNQFGMMQQQMMDQFQNAMGMLVEMFGSLQREQMDLIRQELDQLRDVTREFQDLKAELAAYTRERAEASAVAAVPAPASTPGPLSETATPSYAPPPLDPAPMTPPAVASMTAPPAAPVVEAAGDPVPKPEPATPRPDGARPAAAAQVGKEPSRDPRRTPARPRPEKPAGPGGDGDVMLWLNQRISTLQEERESRWQKILKLLPGSS